jgi:hypothetical protein
MSRYIKKLEDGKVIVYGWDRALGYFYDMWENYGNKEEQCIKERCSLFGMPKSELIEALSEAKAKSPAKFFKNLALDLPDE